MNCTLAPDCGCNGHILPPQVVLSGSPSALTALMRRGGWEAMLLQTEWVGTHRCDICRCRNCFYYNRDGGPSCCNADPLHQAGTHSSAILMKRKVRGKWKCHEQELRLKRETPPAEDILHFCAFMPRRSSHQRCCWTHIWCTHFLKSHSSVRSSACLSTIDTGERPECSNSLLALPVI